MVKRTGVGAEVPKGSKLIHQERAYTSPMWDIRREGHIAREEKP
jgi:hypothetical protein